VKAFDLFIARERLNSSGMFGPRDDGDQRGPMRIAPSSRTLSPLK
jgi:hypothetical protein